MAPQSSSRCLLVTLCSAPANCLGVQVSVLMSWMLAAHLAMTRIMRRVCTCTRWAALWLHPVRSLQVVCYSLACLNNSSSRWAQDYCMPLILRPVLCGTLFLQASANMQGM